MSYAYPPDVAAKAVNELSDALRRFDDMEYANALLADSRMTNTKGLLASCGVKYKGIKFIRDLVAGHIPTLQAQRRALDFLSEVDTMQRQMERGIYAN